MPEFILDKGDTDGAQWFDSLSEFAQGFVEAMFFTDTGSAEDAEDGLESASVAEIAPASRVEIAAFAEQWANRNADLLAEAWRTTRDNGESYDAIQAGRDLWFSGNGHGAGFFDRGLRDIGDKLQDAARYVCESRSLYRGDDGLIYWQ